VSWQAQAHDASRLNRAGTPEEVAGAALLPCSDAGSFITGNDLQVTGGAQL
jgi:glucose 1-dehydrogenase